MSSDVSFIVTNRSVTVAFGGKNFYVTKEDDSDKYDKIIDHIKNGTVNEIQKLFEEKKEKILTYGGGDIRIVDRQVRVRSLGEDLVVPQELSDTLLSYIENNLPFMPLVNFLIKLNKNPSYRSVKQLFTFIQRNKFTITESGNFIAYKGVRDDFTDCYTGKIDNSIGKVVKMPRHLVNDDPDVHCHVGLHVANHDYAFSYYGSGTHKKCIYVEVDPANVVSVPNDHNFAKMRVCEYKVLGLAEGEFNRPLYEENYQDSEEFPEYDDDEDYDPECAECCGSCYVCCML